MTAFTVSESCEYFSGESKIVVETLTGGPGYTRTPTAITGRTIRVISCYDVDAAYDAVKAAVSNGVITVDSGGATTTIYELTYRYA